MDGGEPLDRPGKRQRVAPSGQARAWREEEPSWRTSEAQADRETQRDAGNDLFRHLMAMYALVKITAQDLCVGCFFAHRAGVLGADYARYALPPGLQDGRYQRHLDRAMPQSSPLYTVQTPCCIRRSGDREVRDLPCIVPHEALAREVAADPGIQSRVQQHAWPAVYNSHALVRAAEAEGRQKPIPVSLYVDGVRYTAPLAGRSDSIVGFWLINMLTEKRHLFAVIRSHDMCRCGCRGWCTVYPVHHMLAWSLRAMASGQRPQARHDGGPWTEEDANVGAPLGYTACLLWIKGDWAEMAHTMGLPPCTAKHCPCPFCRSDKAGLHTGYRRMSLSSMPHAARADEDYDEACRARQHPILVATEAIRQAILTEGRLHYRKGRKGMGRELRAPVPLLGLRQGDRLEPSPTLMDVAKFDDQPVPFQAVFWRASRDARGSIQDQIFRPNPVFSNDLGINPWRSLAIDPLHTLYYGPVMRWAAAALWRVLLANPWGVVGTQEVRVELGCRRLRESLFGWQEEVGIPAQDRLHDWTLPMMGSDEGCVAEPGKPHPGTVLKTKAAETGLVLRWAVALLDVHAAVVPHGAELLRAGVALERYVGITRTSPQLMGQELRQELMDCAVRHLLHCERAQVHYVPKHHMFMHLTERRP